MRALPSMVRSVVAQSVWLCCVVCCALQAKQQQEGGEGGQQEEQKQEQEAGKVDQKEKELVSTNA